MINYWILNDDHTVTKVDLMTWARWFEQRDRRRVALDLTKYSRISTVHLGLDHQWGNGPPLIFESMAFERESTVKEMFGRLHKVNEEEECVRYSSYDDAIAGHRAMVRRYRRREAAAIASHPTPQEESK